MTEYAVIILLGLCVIFLFLNGLALNRIASEVSITRLVMPKLRELKELAEFLERNK